MFSILGDDIVQKLVCLKTGSIQHSTKLDFKKFCLFLQDMTTLSYLNEPGVLWNLKSRYVLDAIYTYTGSILIAVNPFAALPMLYGTHMMEQYQGRALGELSPHVYAIADAAYRQMRKDGKSQSILVRNSRNSSKAKIDSAIAHFSCSCMKLMYGSLLV